MTTTSIKDKKLKASLNFQCIENSTIFDSDFSPFTKNNKIEFSTNKHIAVVYAPNGTGKTSLSRVLERSKGTKYEAIYKIADKIINAKEVNLFHIIQDQNNRNIIKGEAEDFLIGDNITKKIELKEGIQAKIIEYCKACREILSKYGITTKTSKLFTFYSQPLKGILEEIVNQNNRQGTEYWNKIPDLYRALENDCISTSDFNKYTDATNIEKTKLFVQGYCNQKSAISRYLNIDISKITSINNGHEVIECNDALRILQKYDSKDQCVVCDNKIDRIKLLNLKEKRRNAILSKIDEKLREEVLFLLDLNKDSDPFEISKHLSNFLDGDISSIDLMSHRDKIMEHGTVAAKCAQYEAKVKILTTNLESSYAELESIIKSEIKIDDNDMDFLQNNVRSCMDKELIFEYNKDDANISIKLDEKVLLNEDRSILPLSTGEQNFISLAFEIIRAKSIEKQVIIIDDPLSSFDSIYRYKIIYLMLSALKEKNVIIFTHNTDLIRLLDIQHKNCFSLYLFNNVNGGDNGFLPISDEEKKLIIYLDELPKLIRNKEFCKNNVKNKELFLTAILPYMRGFANYIGNQKTYDNLTTIMHGYNDEEVNLSEHFLELFKHDTVQVAHHICSDYIINLKISPEAEIVHKNNYPLLNKALAHSLIFLKLRLLVEQKLVSKYKINTKANYQLGQIIRKAYGDDNLEKRTFLMSKKSLLNEFNHFEGNLSFFQPALDINDTLLAKEQQEIEDFFESEKY